MKFVAKFTWMVIFKGYCGLVWTWVKTQFFLILHNFNL